MSEESAKYTETPSQIYSAISHPTSGPEKSEGLTSCSHYHQVRANSLCDLGEVDIKL